MFVFIIQLEEKMVSEADPLEEAKRKRKAKRPTRSNLQYRANQKIFTIRKGLIEFLLVLPKTFTLSEKKNVPLPSRVAALNTWSEERGKVPTFRI